MDNSGWDNPNILWLNMSNQKHKKNQQKKNQTKAGENNSTPSLKIIYMVIIPSKKKESLGRWNLTIEEIQNEAL